MILEKRVLIETLWNVKQQKELTLSMLRCGFNRNIVECKVDRIGIL